MPVAQAIEAGSVRVGGLVFLGFFLEAFGKAVLVDGFSEIVDRALLEAYRFTADNTGYGSEALLHDECPELRSIT
jgi:hypothetical protein